MVLKEADNKNPPAEVINELIKLYQDGSLSKVSDQIERLLDDYQGSFVLYNLKGAVSLSHGNFLDAEFNFKKAIELKADDQNANNNLGIVLKEQGKIDEAILVFERALEINSQFPEALNNLGHAHIKKGNIPDAAEKLIMAINIKPDYAQPFIHLSSLLPFLIIREGNPRLEEIMLTLLEKKYVDRPIKISKAINSLLKSNQEIKSCLSLVSSEWNDECTVEQLIKLSNIPLLLKFMELCPIVDLELEWLFRKIRKNILINISALKKSERVFDFCLALAQQCFTNEYIYPVSNQEVKEIEGLEKVVEDLLEEGKQPKEIQVVCLACYKPLHSYEWCSRLDLTSFVNQLIDWQISEPLREKNIGKNIKFLTGEEDEVSFKVGKQYEENPYPRWVDMGLNFEKKGIREIATDANLFIYDQTIFENNAPRILIAGCGTGQHAISRSQAIKNCDVLAIDLSTASLAYAERKTQEFGIKNVEYMKADILNLEKLGKKFDIIECVGVLHHMEKPIDGWRVLKNCLKTNGLIRIGLYSKVARESIFEIKNKIDKKKIEREASQMIAFRDELINSDEPIDESIIGSDDFYSLSGFRDLLFHVQEHTFTISEIIDALGQLQLSFCGFELPNPRVKKDFMELYPNESDFYNLKAWEKFESNNSDAFHGMYQFWCQNNKE